MTKFRIVKIVHHWLRDPTQSGLCYSDYCRSRKVNSKHRCQAHYSGPPEIKYYVEKKMLLWRRLKQSFASVAQAEAFMLSLTENPVISEWVLQRDNTLLEISANQPLLSRL